MESDWTMTNIDQNFRNVINKMILDDVSSLAKSDHTILTIGSRIYNSHKCKTEKKNEVEKRVRQTMRLLSRLYIYFKDSFGHSTNSVDMFNKTNLKHLRSAIDVMCEEDDKLKSGLKVQIQNTLKQSSRIIEAHFLVEGNDKKAEEVCEFVKVFGLVEEEIFNGALYDIHQKRNKTTRKPANLPSSDLVNKLNKYLTAVTTKENFVLEAPETVFVNIRDAACARLTIYNGRRGGEPTRLFIYQWLEAVNGVWLREETRESYKKEIETGNRITYQEGKGKRQVPVFIPPALVDAMEFLCSSEIRRESGVGVGNKYVFPSTQKSNNHVSGWHALDNCCKKCDLNGKITGTINRHRLASLIGALGLPESDQLLAFDHFGHSGDVNKNIYQVPQAERQLATTGKYLQMIDNSSPSNESCKPLSSITNSSSQLNKPVSSSTPKRGMSFSKHA